MAGVMNGRYTAKVNEPFVVFIIGMRINNVFAVRKWFPAVRAMFPMLRELSGHSESHCRAGASGSCACRTVGVLELDLEGGWGRGFRRSGPRSCSRGWVGQTKMCVQAV